MVEVVGSAGVLSQRELELAKLVQESDLVVRNLDLLTAVVSN